MNKIVKCYSWLITLILLLSPISKAQGTFCETGGIVSMEAENADVIKGWNPVPGKSGTARIDASARGAGYMQYEVTFTKSGNYYVFLMCRYTGSNSGEANDCFITLEGQKLYGSDNVTRPDGIRCHCSYFCWSSLPKGPGGHTPDNIRNDPVYAKVPSPGTYTFKITSRSMGFIVDKIVMQLNSSRTPTPMGPDEIKCYTSMVAAPIMVENDHCSAAFPNPMATQVYFSFPGQIEILSPSGHSICAFTGHTWDGRDNRGGMVQPGIYLYRVNGNIQGKIVKQ